MQYLGVFLNIFFPYLIQRTFLRMLLVKRTEGFYEAVNIPLSFVKLLNNVLFALITQKS